VTSGVRSGVGNNRAFKLACARIRRCINDGYSGGFHGVPAEKFWRFRDRVRRVWKGVADDRSVSTEGELLIHAVTVA